jgi:hypothetical protein
MANNSSVHQDGDVCSNALLCSDIFLVATIVSVVGILANACVLGTILYVRRLHRPIFLGFAALALADFLYLIFNTFRVHLNWFTGHENEADTATIVLGVLIITSAFSSACHVTFLSVQQYFMIAYPLSSLARQTNKTVLYASMALWIVCIIPSSVYIYSVKISKDDVLGRVMNFVITITATFLPISIIVICHFLKLKALRKSVTNDRPETRQKLSKIVSLVILSYFITTLPMNIHDTVKLAGKSQKVLSTPYMVLYRIALVLLQLSFTINPFIYFICTPHCRRVVRFKCCKPHSTETSSRQTRSTLLLEEHCSGRPKPEVQVTAM